MNFSEIWKEQRPICLQDERLFDYFLFFHLNTTWKQLSVVSLGKNGRENVLTNNDAFERLYLDKDSDACLLIKSVSIKCTVHNVYTVISIFCFASLETNFVSHKRRRK